SPDNWKPAIPSATRETVHNYSRCRKQLTADSGIRCSFSKALSGLSCWSDVPTLPAFFWREPPRGGLEARYVLRLERAGHGSGVKFERGALPSPASVGFLAVA